MAGRGTISVNQTKQYGDQTAIDTLKKGLTTTPMTGNPTPAPTAGRPSEGGSAPPTDSMGNTLGIPQGHREAAADLAAKAWSAREWAILAQSPTAGPRIRAYAEASQKILEAASVGTYKQTPNFE